MPRVVVLDSGQLDSVLALGVRPVGAAESSAPGRGFVAYLDTAGIASVGPVHEPDLDRVAALRPDLIVGARIRHAEWEGALARIAPTLLSASVGGVWQENLLDVANALGRRERAEQVLEAYRSRVADARARGGARLAMTRVSYVRAYGWAGRQEVRIYLRRSFAGSVLADLGVPRPPAQAEDGARRFAAVAPARLQDLDGDVLFLSVYGPGSREVLARLRADPRWGALTAVRRGRVYNVDDDVWAVGTGPAGANRLIGDVLRYAAGVPAEKRGAAAGTAVLLAALVASASSEVPGRRDG